MSEFETLARKHWQEYQASIGKLDKSFVGIAFDLLPKTAQESLVEAMEKTIATPPGSEVVPEEVIEILKTVEHAGRDRDGDSCCPICDAYYLVPHNKDCKLSAILTRHRAAQQGTT